MMRAPPITLTGDIDGIVNLAEGTVVGLAEGTIVEVSGAVDIDNEVQVSGTVDIGNMPEVQLDLKTYEKFTPIVRNIGPYSTAEGYIDVTGYKTIHIIYEEDDPQLSVYVELAWAWDDAGTAPIIDFSSLDVEDIYSFEVRSPMIRYRVQNTANTARYIKLYIYATTW